MARATLGQGPGLTDSGFNEPGIDYSEFNTGAAGC